MEKISVIVLVKLQVAQMPQRESYTLDFLGSNHLCCRRKLEQGELLLNNRKIVFMCYDDDNNSSHVPNQVDYWTKSEIKFLYFFPESWKPWVLKTLSWGLGKGISLRPEFCPDQWHLQLECSSNCYVTTNLMLTMSAHFYFRHEIII